MAALEAPPTIGLDWKAVAADLDKKSPLEVMDHVRSGPLFRASASVLRELVPEQALAVTTCPEQPKEQPVAVRLRLLKATPQIRPDVLGIADGTTEYIGCN